MAFHSFIRAISSVESLETARVVGGDMRDELSEILFQYISTAGPCAQFQPPPLLQAYTPPLSPAFIHTFHSFHCASSIHSIPITLLQAYIPPLSHASSYRPIKNCPFLTPGVGQKKKNEKKTHACFTVELSDFL